MIKSIKNKLLVADYELLVTENMHDFLLAKEIINKVLEIAEEKELKNIRKVNLEIGSIALSHDDLPEHTEDISLENLEFGMKNIAGSTVLKNTEFALEKMKGNNWKITNIEVE